MTDKAKKIAEVLRTKCSEQGDCNSCAKSDYCYYGGEYVMRNEAAELIESLSAELEQVKQECDGMSIMLTSATSAAETYKRERDAAVKDLHLWGCFSCKHAGHAHSEICASCVYNRNRIAKGYVSGKNRYEWRGVRE